MIDMKALTAVHTSPASARRVRRRRRAETRLKLYGAAAILLAALALATLLWSVFARVGDALTENYVELPTDFASSRIDAENVAKSNFTGLMKDTLKATFPDVRKRGDKRVLYGLLSSGAAFELGAFAAGDPGLIGREAPFDYLLSDDADLYLKGGFGALQQLAAPGALTLEGDVGKPGAAVRATAETDLFRATLTVVKTQLAAAAARARREAARQENARSVFAARATATADEDDHANLLARADASAAKRDALLARADDLTRRAAAKGGDEALTGDTPSLFIAAGGGWLRATRVSPDRLEAVVASPLASADGADWRLYMMETPQNARKITDKQIVWLETLREQGRITSVFNWRFFSSGDSREAELAGVWGAVMGSFWTMLVTFLLAFPLGVMAAIYLEEFAPKNRFTGFVEVNINNLAAVPSIVFGLLGLAIFVSGIEVGLWGRTVEIGGFLPRSAPLAGGAVLALMTLPTIIIASRAAIRAVPPSIRDAALGVGASRLQMVFHHVLPLAAPGVMTGAIIGMAQALGETAPLIMIGMVAFIVDIPGGVTDSATALPVQIYRWSDFPERAFDAKTALAIVVLLGFLLLMNLIAIILRRRFERRW